MNCVHCGDPLPGPWHMSQEDRLPELRVGSLVVAKKASGGLRPGRISGYRMAATGRSVTRMATGRFR